MAGLTGRIQRFPSLVFVALDTSNLRVILIEDETRHRIVIKQQVISLPAGCAVTLPAIDPQHFFVGIIRFMARITVVLDSTRLSRHCDSLRIVASAALRQQMLAKQMLAARFILEDVILSNFLWPRIKSVTGDATWTIRLRMLNLVASFTTCSQSLERCGSKLLARCLRFVAPEAREDRVLTGKGELGVPVMIEPEILDAP